MRLLIIVYFALLSLFSFGQINHNGLPFIRNFSPDDYDGSDQNWSVVQDKRGLIYIGNNNRGVMEFDGRTWRKITVPQDVMVRALGVDTLGTVYVGLVNDFGYLKPNAGGRLEYKSLRQLVTDTLINFNHIEKIHTCKDNSVYFYNANYLFIYNGHKVDVVNINRDGQAYNRYSFIVNNRYYIGSFRLGLRELIDTTLSLAPNGQFFINKNIVSIMPYKGNWVSVVCNKGLYRYNQLSGEVIDYTQTHSFYSNSIEDAFTYQATKMADSTIGIAYVFGNKYSFAQIDSLGSPLRVLNKSLGLYDETVTNLYQHRTEHGSSPLWIPLNVGISKVDVHSQIARFSTESGLMGSITGVAEFNETLFVFTLSGAFFLTYDDHGFAHFKHIPQINTAVWSHLLFRDPQTGRNRLILGTLTDGIVEVDKNFKVINIDYSQGLKKTRDINALFLYQPKEHPEIIYICETSSFSAIELKDGIWRDLGVIKREHLRFDYRSIASSKPNELWLGTISSGVSRVQFNENDTIVKHFGVEDGLPEISENSVFEIDGIVYVATFDGIYHYNEEIETFEPAVLPGLKQPIKGYGVNKVIKFEKGYAIGCHNREGKRWIEVVYPWSNIQDTIISKPLKSLPSRWTEYLFNDSKGILWCAISTDLFTFNKSIKRDYNEPFNALIRRVTTGRDSLLFYGTFFRDIDDGRRIITLEQQSHQRPTLAYSLNSINFEIAATFFEKEEETLFSYFLEGNDKEWSSWNADPRPAYMNLREGSYTFMVKAKNIYGEESSIAYFSFSIKPPWYRTIVAYIVYLLLSVSLVWVIVVLNTRRLVAEKEHLEQIVKERTAEVVAQKEEIAHQNEEIKSSISYASRIQNALLTPKETIDAMYDDYFILFLPRDIVSGDFYWNAQVGNRKICVVADCTGHGVPGGFMSMLGIGYLTQIMTKGDHFTAAEILNQLRCMIIESLHQTGKQGESKDGMDLALYIIDTDKGVIEFAGANNPLVLIRENEIIQYKPDKMPIGIHIKCDEPFTNQVFEYIKGDVIYTFSDGYPDQFGGPDERKFMIKRLKELFLEIHQKPMEEQKEILQQTLLEWEQNSERIDDIVIMGLRL